MAHSRSLLRNGLIQSPETIRPISYITFSLSFTIHQLSLRLIYEAYFIFREFSDDRKLISSALVLLWLWPNLKAGRAEIALIFSQFQRVAGTVLCITTAQS